MTWQHTVLLIWLAFDTARGMYYVGRGWRTYSVRYLIVTALLSIPWLVLFVTGQTGEWNWKDYTLIGVEVASLALTLFYLGQGGHDEDYDEGPALTAFFALLLSGFFAYLLITG